MAKKYLILPSQKNQVLEAVLQAGLDPADFEWLELHKDLDQPSEGLVALLRHVPTDYEFEFDMRSERLLACFSPSPERPSHTQQVESWGSMRAMVQIWLQSLKHEYETPDMWAEFAHAAEVSADEANGERLHGDDPVQSVHPVAMAHFKNWEKRQSEAKRRRANAKKEFLFRVQGF